jgi:GTP pyrophosphokinase
VKSLQHQGLGIESSSELEQCRVWCSNQLPSSDSTASFKSSVIRRLDILDQVEADAGSKIAITIYTAWNYMDLSETQLQAQFGGHLTELAVGIKTMDAISSMNEVSATGSHAEGVRKMLIAMIDDVRVVMIRLACQLDNMREAKHVTPSLQVELGRITLEVFAPLANRLGIWQFKWELEDLALRYTRPEEYKSLAHKLAERRIDREEYIESFKNNLNGMLEKSGIQGEVTGRPKHLYSIFRKMKLKGLDLENIYDVRAVRILVETVAECYAVLGLVHTQWSPVKGEFDDYIATPKHNGYQSIHTAVIGPDGKIVEVQIRTHEMHSDNELGVAAHWRYKENSKQDAAMDSKILWLRQLLDWKQELEDSAGLFEQFQNEVDDRRVYVFSPKGKVIDLPEGSTPLDFAYTIHTEVGNRCRGAKIGGKMVSLTYALKNGEQVEILTIRSGKPSRDWLNPNLGYIHTQRARARIQRWFKSEDFDINLSAGRSNLERELDRLGVVEAAYEQLAEHSGFKKVDEFLAAIGSGDLKISQAVSSLRAPAEPKRDWTMTRRPPTLERARGMEIQGVGNLLTQSAACCNPLPGDEIIGYITQGRGISIHKQECGNILRLPEDKQARLIHIQWGDRDAEVFPVDLAIHAIDRKGLLHDVSGVLKDLAVNVLSTATQSNAKEHSAMMRIRVEVKDVSQLSHLLGKISQIPNVTKASRLIQ